MARAQQEGSLRRSVMRKHFCGKVINPKALSGQAHSSTPIAHKQVPLFDSTITPVNMKRTTRRHVISKSLHSGSPKESDELPNSSSLSKSEIANQTNSESRKVLGQISNQKETSTLPRKGSKSKSHKFSLSRKKDKQNKENISSSTQIEHSSVRRKHKFRPGTRALMEIRQYQKRTDLLIPRLSFYKLVKEVFMDLGAGNYKMQRLACEALQEASEAYLTFVFEMANLCSIHAKRVTLFPSDLRLAKKIRGDYL